MGVGVRYSCYFYAYAVSYTGGSMRPVPKYVCGTVREGERGGGSTFENAKAGEATSGGTWEGGKDARRERESGGLCVRERGKKRERVNMYDRGRGRGRAYVRCVSRYWVVLAFSVYLASVRWGVFEHTIDTFDVFRVKLMNAIWRVGTW